MSKKKNNNEAVNETAEIVENVETPIEDVNEENVINEAANDTAEAAENTESSVEDTNEENIIAETTEVEQVNRPEETTKIESPVVEKELSEVEFEEVPTPEVVEPTPTEVPVAPVKIADPLPEVNGNFYVNFGDMSDRKEVKVKAAIEKCGYNHIVTATGEVLAGPFATDYDTNVARKKIAGLGFKGVVYTFE